jgi:hypothetical protein
MPRRYLITILLVPLVAAGCLGRTTHHATTATTASTPRTTTAAAQMSLTVFRVENGKLAAENARVPQTTATAGASLEALGIDAGVTIADGTATVDLPDATADQVAEIVYTLTQFPTVQRVDVGGKTGLTRADVDTSYLPQISIETPAAGGTVSKTFHVTGTAQVFEATFVLELQIAGNVAVKQTVTASAGAPARGTFDVTLTSPSLGAAKLVAFEPSAADGSPLHAVTVPVSVVP